MVQYLQHETLRHAAVHCLEAVLCDHQENQEIFERLSGMKTVANLLKQKKDREEDKKNKKQKTKNKKQKG